MTNPNEGMRPEAIRGVPRLARRGSGHQRVSLQTGRRGSLVVIASGSKELKRRLRADLGPAFVIRPVATLEEVIALFDALTPAVVVLDRSILPDPRVTAVSRLSRRGSMTRLFVLAASPSEEEGASFLHAGARGYCARDIDQFLLQKAVTTLQKGEIWASRRLLSALVESTIRRPAAPPASRRTLEPLTVREREIASMVGTGQRNKEIAARLGISEPTVKAHMTAIFRKLGVSSRVEVALAGGACSPAPVPVREAPPDVAFTAAADLAQTA